MQIEIVETDHETCLSLGDHLDLYTAQELRDELEKAIRRPVKAVVINMQKLAYIDSRGIDVLLKAAIYAESFGIDLAMINCRPTIVRTLKLRGMDSIFENVIRETVS